MASKDLRTFFANNNVGPTIAVNPGNAYFVPADSPYKTMDDILAAAEADTPVRVAIQLGGVSEIGFTAMLNPVRLRAPGSEANIVPVNPGAQSDKYQAMWDELADVINGSIQANEQFAQLPADDPTAMHLVRITATPETLAQAPEEGIGATNRWACLCLARNLCAGNVGLEVAPFTIGFILGPSAEIYFVKSRESFGDLTIFFTKSWIAVILWVLIAGSLAASLGSRPIKLLETVMLA